MPNGTSKLRALLALAGFIVAAALLLRLAFFVFDLQSGRSSNVVAIGSKADTEGVLIGEIMAELIERQTALKVVRRTNLGGTQICFEALRAGEIDLYPEYTGTALVAILDRPVVSDARQAFETVRDELGRRDALVLLEPMRFDNTYALAMAEPKAAAAGITRISDLKRHPELRAGFTAEFMARKDGWLGLRKKYGFAFSEEPHSMEAGLMYRAVAAAELDVIGAYATDGRLEKFGLRVLDDDLGFFPPYQAAALVRRDTLGRHPEIGRALSVLGNKIDDAEMRRLNAAVDVEHRPVDAVARALVDELLAGNLL